MPKETYYIQNYRSHKLFYDKSFIVQVDNTLESKIGGKITKKYYPKETKIDSRNREFAKSRFYYICRPRKDHCNGMNRKTQ